MKSADRRQRSRFPFWVSAVLPFAALFGAGRAEIMVAAAPGPLAQPETRQAAPAAATVADAGRKPQLDRADLGPADARNSAPRPPAPSGVIFSGRYEEIAKVKIQMQQLLVQMNWTGGQVQTREAQDGKQVAYVLNSSPGDFSTLDLPRRPQLGLAPEAIAFRDRQGHERTLSLVSQKEILAAMLQQGRALAFSGENCSVAKLQEQLALRQNIVYWGSRADWVFPEDKIYRYNTAEYWQEMLGDDWTLKPQTRPSQAIADAFVGKFSYQIGCTSACRFIVAHGILDYFARVQPNPSVLARMEARLDPRRPFLEMAPTVDRGGALRKEGLFVDRQFDVPSEHWIPGDWGWIKNLDAKSAEELGSEGCNIIYAGGGMFVNYYPERPPKTLDQSIKRVYGWQFGIEEGDLELRADLAKQLRQDPRAGGLLRDVRDVPKFFSSSSAPRPGA